VPARPFLGPTERLVALGAVTLVQLALGLFLLWGLRVQIRPKQEFVTSLIQIPLRPTERPKVVTPRERPLILRRPAAAAASEKPASGPNSNTSSAPPRISNELATPSFASGHLPDGASGVFSSGAGNGGQGGEGTGAGDGGGTDLVQIAGAILPQDYPRELRQRGLGGRVRILFTVGTDG
jgi:protein TonB